MSTSQLRKRDNECICKILFYIKLFFFFSILGCIIYILEEDGITDIIGMEYLKVNQAFDNAHLVIPYNCNLPIF